MRVVVIALVGTVVGLVCCSSTPSNVDGGSDTGVADTKADKQISPDSGGDSGGTCPSGLACEVCDNGFTPVQMVAPTNHPALCQTADITAYVTACGANGNSTTCNAWQTSENTSAPNCLGCVFSANTDTKWGANVCDSSGNCQPNAGGCTDVVTGLVSQEKQAGGAGSCGDLINTDLGCQNYACGNCTSNTDFNTCQTSVVAHQCSSYDGPLQAQTGVCAVLAGADAATAATVNSCFANTDADLQILVGIMCGS